MATTVGRFASYLNTVAPTLPSLPILHTTTSLGFRDAVEDGALRATACTVFKGSNLAYTFYGKPAYRLSSTSASKEICDAPVSILFRPHCLGDSFRTFPFDTGGFDLYKAKMPGGVTLDSFSLNGGPENPGRIVTTFYGNNKKYLGEKPAKPKFDAIEFELIAYLQLISSGGKSSYDDRRSTIEVQFDKDLPITKANVMAIVLPEPLLDSKWIKKRVLGDLGAVPITYRTHLGTPNEYMGAIYVGVSDYYKRVLGFKV